MQSSSDNSLFPLIQWLLGGGFLASLFGYFWNKYFRICPKINVTRVWGGSQQSYDGANWLRFVWTPKLILHNDSIHKARRIKLIYSENIDNWKFTSKIPETIEPDHKEEWPFEITRSEARNVLMEICGEAALRENWLSKAYLPVVIGNAKLVFAYDSDKERTFYTVVEINGNILKSTLHWRKPQISNKSKSYLLGAP